jgi:hypothetical protein
MESNSSYKKQVPAVSPGDPLHIPSLVLISVPVVSALEFVAQTFTVNDDASQKYKRHSLLLAPKYQWW